MMPASGTFSNTEEKLEFDHWKKKNDNTCPTTFTLTYIFWLLIPLTSYKPFDEKTLAAKRTIEQSDAAAITKM